MTTLAWVIGLGILAYFIFHFPRFRKYIGYGALGLTVLGILVGGIYWIVNGYQERGAKSLIASQQLDITNLRLTTESFGMQNIGGQIKNNSSYTLTDLTMKVQAYDCPTQKIGQDCEIIGEDDIYFYIRIPAGHRREVNSFVSFLNMAPAKKQLLVGV